MTTPEDPTEGPPSSNMELWPAPEPESDTSDVLVEDCPELDPDFIALTDGHESGEGTDEEVEEEGQEEEVQEDGATALMNKKVI